ncbi:hypothetical protein HOLleu_24407 [Holothuria leucospilota]|uniref:Uncharacterized protein n=1 Tax=Holothuria leucospilota TaxID=206669 RepID=A0A9Q1BW72_HOLLE|nr:hypothetical protein HOLleu_24407 [Holothuria leucospilota]
MWKCRHIHSSGLVCFKVWYPCRRPASTQVGEGPCNSRQVKCKVNHMAQPVNLDGEGLSAEHGKHKESVTQNCKEDFLRKNVRFGRTIQLKRGLSYTRHYR